ncbi:MAG: hypothetical protein LBU55_03485 [Elusimicrobiota bacterium]|jgi:hypothetical protein|nr:hypothetical protein [Elusimicrobiota bacterium]
MISDVLIIIFFPILTGFMYFWMALEVKKISKLRSLIFGEIAFKKMQFAFVIFGIYFASRPLQNILGVHPMPLIINCIRQFFLMAIVAPSILVAIFHWIPQASGAPRSEKFASYTVGTLMAIIFILLNSLAVDGSLLLCSTGFIDIYDPVWFQNKNHSMQLVVIHLICQLVSPVGFLLLSAAYVRNRRHNYQLSDVYNLMTTKWKYLEFGLTIFAFSFITAGVTAILGAYYTYIWVIYFIGAIISGFFVLKSLKLPLRKAEGDLL